MKEIIQKQIEELEKYPPQFEKIISDFETLKDNLDQILKNKNDIASLNKLITELRSEQIKLNSLVKKYKGINDKNTNKFITLETSIQALETSIAEVNNYKNVINSISHSILETNEKTNQNGGQIHEIQHQIIVIKDNLEKFKFNYVELIKKFGKHFEIKIESIKRNSTHQFNIIENHLNKIFKKQNELDKIYMQVQIDLNRVIEKLNEKDNLFRLLKSNYEEIKLKHHYLEGNLKKVQICLAFIILVLFLLIFIK